MSIQKQDIERIANLARLELKETEVPQYLDQLNKTLDLLNALQRIDTEGVSPMSHPLGTHLSLREDVVTKTNQREKFQAIAPKGAVEAGLYLVNQVIE